jgi:hypothetical protein
MIEALVELEITSLEGRDDFLGPGKVFRMN